MSWRWQRNLSRIVLVAVGLLVVGCGAKSTKESSPQVPTVSEGGDRAVIADPAVIRDDNVRMLSLSGDEPVPVADSELEIRISGSSHKARAPVVAVQILVSQGDDKAELGWTIKSGQIDSAWRKIEGRRWDAESEQYLDEEIAGWLVRLDSVDGSSAGGSPTAITISVKRVP